MVKEEKLILQVKENKNKQKRVTIPKESKIKDKDYVEVKKVKQNESCNADNEEKGRYLP